MYGMWTQRHRGVCHLPMLTNRRWTLVNIILALTIISMSQIQCQDLDVASTDCKLSLNNDCTQLILTVPSDWKGATVSLDVKAARNTNCHLTCTHTARMDPDNIIIITCKLTAKAEDCCTKTKHCFEATIEQCESGITHDCFQSCPARDYVKEARTCKLSISRIIPPTDSPTSTSPSSKSTNHITSSTSNNPSSSTNHITSSTSKDLSSSTNHITSSTSNDPSYSTNHITSSTSKDLSSSTNHITHSTSNDLSLSTNHITHSPSDDLIASNRIKTDSNNKRPLSPVIIAVIVVSVVIAIGLLLTIAVVAHRRHFYECRRPNCSRKKDKTRTVHQTNQTIFRSHSEDNSSNVQTCSESIDSTNTIHDSDYSKLQRFSTHDNVYNEPHDDSNQLRANRNSNGDSVFTYSQAANITELSSANITEIPSANITEISSVNQVQNSVHHHQRQPHATLPGQNNLMNHSLVDHSLGLNVPNIKSPHLTEMKPENNLSEYFILESEQPSFTTSTDQDETEMVYSLQTRIDSPYTILEEVLSDMDCVLRENQNSHFQSGAKTETCEEESQLSSHPALYSTINELELGQQEAIPKDCNLQDFSNSLIFANEQGARVDNVYTILEPDENPRVHQLESNDIDDVKFNDTDCKNPQENQYFVLEQSKSMTPANEHWSQRNNTDSDEVIPDYEKVVSMESGANLNDMESGADLNDSQHPSLDQYKYNDDVTLDKRICTDEYQLASSITQIEPNEYQLGSSINQTESNEYELGNSTTQTESSEYELGSSTTQTESNEYELASSNTQIGPNEYQLASSINQTESNEYELGSSITQTESSEYELGCPITQTESNEYELGSSITQIESSEYELGCPITQTESNEYELGSSINQTESSEYELGSSINQTESSEYELGCPITQTESNEYELGCSITQIESNEYELANSSG